MFETYKCPICKADFSTPETCEFIGCVNIKVRYTTITFKDPDSPFFVASDSSLAFYARNKLLLIVFRVEIFMKELTLKSPAFEANKKIPKKYTCEGEGVSPPLTIEGVPSEAKTLALICEDPDAVSGTFDHWVCLEHSSIHNSNRGK